MTDYRARVLSEVDAERSYQDQKWGHEADDTLNRPNDWVAYIAHHSTRWFAGEFAPYQPGVIDRFRKELVKTAALAVAAVESLDRQRAEAGRPFYEDSPLPPAERGQAEAGA